MSNGRLELRRATLAVCVFVLMGAITGVCPGQAPSEKTPAANMPAPKAATSPAKAGGGTSSPGAASQSTAKAGQAGLPKTPSASGAHNSAAAAKSGAASAAGQGVAAQLPKPATPRESSSAPGHRDPFKAWVAPSSADHSALDPVRLPAGTRGLVISGLRLEGIVRQQPADEMIAVVTNDTKRAYFLRVNDTVYNGVVSKITPAAIYFKENTLTAQGRVVTREVEIKLGSALGEGR
jgi:hypothetical protein